ncbi:hypothetical protein FQ192_04730 [Pseudomonas sp. ANT_J12]|nr:hypothetical protein FQ192_04730 [Pseudomonas sp. ANT_J12]
MATHENDLMDGQRAVFERGILAQRPLLIRTWARSKGYMNIPARLGYSPCRSKACPRRTITRST